LPGQLCKLNGRHRRNFGPGNGVPYSSPQPPVSPFILSSPSTKSSRLRLLTHKTHEQLCIIYKDLTYLLGLKCPSFEQVYLRKPERVSEETYITLELHLGSLWSKTSPLEKSGWPWKGKWNKRHVPNPKL
jgi:hypothetical protein